jgi:uncharacterized RDD family membrane protein YckC
VTARHAAAKPALLGRVKHQTIDLVTPEGVPLSFNVALAGDRLIAFILDYLIITGITLFFGLLAAVSGVHEMMALALVVNFLVRNFYFMFFEQRWQGSTPGKRGRKLRVIDAGGGLLSVQAVIVRNLTRDLEIFLPLIVIFAPEEVMPGMPPYLSLIALAWMLVFGFLPLFNKQRRRIGDLIAGTMVIDSPQVSLLGDLTETPEAQAANKGSAYSFTEAQLLCYGDFELQVLEEFLRTSVTGNFVEQAELICTKIRLKIGWEGEVAYPLDFLREFYAAQRAHLERRMLLGKRRKDKNAEEE